MILTLCVEAQNNIDTAFLELPIDPSSKHLDWWRELFLDTEKVLDPGKVEVARPLGFLGPARVGIV